MHFRVGKILFFVLKIELVPNRFIWSMDEISQRSSKFIGLIPSALACHIDFADEE